MVAAWARRRAAQPIFCGKSREAASSVIGLPVVLDGHRPTTKQVGSRSLRSQCEIPEYDSERVALHERIERDRNAGPR